MGSFVFAPPALAFDNVFSGTWSIIGPATHEMLGARLRFSELASKSAHVEINQMSGSLRESDGTSGSNYVVHTESYSCYYDVVVLTGRSEMTWRLARSEGFPCVNSFHARKDP